MSDLKLTFSVDQRVVICDHKGVRELATVSRVTRTQLGVKSDKNPMKELVYRNSKYLTLNAPRYMNYSCTKIRTLKEMAEYANEAVIQKVIDGRIAKQEEAKAKSDGERAARYKKAELDLNEKIAEHWESKGKEAWYSAPVSETMGYESRTIKFDTHRGQSAVLSILLHEVEEFSTRELSQVKKQVAEVSGFVMGGPVSDLRPSPKNIQSLPASDLAALMYDVMVRYM